MTLTNSTVSGNSAGNVGGGISNVGSLMLINSTVSGNRANFSGDGIFNNGKRIYFNATIADNRHIVVLRVFSIEQNPRLTDY
jgi:hypothetical protein